LRSHLRDASQRTPLLPKIKARDDYLPKRIAAQEQRADDLIKAAKGLGGKIK